MITGTGKIMTSRVSNLSFYESGNPEKRLSTVTDERVSEKSFCLAGYGEEKLVFFIELKIQ